MNNGLFLVLFLFSCTCSEKKEINYNVNNVNHKGFLVNGVKKDEKKPGILVVHEWWGHNDYAKKRAKMLGEAGYVAMSIDMYGEGKVANHPKEAKKFAMTSMKNAKLAKKKFIKALEILKKHPNVDSNKIVAVGYCFGGAVVLNMARSGLELDLVGSFHGSLKSPLKSKNIKAKKVLVFNGEDDPMITKEEIKSFKKEMKKLNVNLLFKNYAKAKHAFTNPIADELGQKYSLPLAYDKNADKDSWNILLKEIESL